MDYKKALLGAASVLALTAGVQGYANASIPAPDKHVKASDARRLTPSTASDAVIDFVMRTKGKFSAAKIEHTLAEMFANPSHEQIESFPEFLASISTLGLTSEASTRAREMLIGLAASAPSIDETARHALLARLNVDPRPIMLAERRPKRPKEPTATGSFAQSGGHYR